MKRKDVVGWERWHRSEPTPQVYAAFLSAWDGSEYAALEEDFIALNALSCWEEYGQDAARALKARGEQLERISIIGDPARASLLKAYRRHFTDNDTAGSGRFAGFRAGNASLLGPDGLAARLSLLACLRRVFLARSEEEADASASGYIAAKGKDFPAARFSERLHLTRPDLYPVCNEVTVDAFEGTFPGNLTLARNYLTLARALRRAIAEEGISSFAVLDRFIGTFEKVPQSIVHRTREVLVDENANVGSASTEEGTSRIFIEKFVGEEVVRLYRRNQALVASARRAAGGKCSACRGDTVATYGVDIVEVHHRERFADIDPDTPLTLADVAALCPNCHRALHALSRGESVMSTKALAEVLEKQTR